MEYWLEECCGKCDRRILCSYLFYLFHPFYLSFGLNYLIFVAPFCVNGVYYKNGTARGATAKHFHNQTVLTRRLPYGAIYSCEHQILKTFGLLKIFNCSILIIPQLNICGENNYLDKALIKAFKSSSVLQRKVRLRPVMRATELYLALKASSSLW